MEKIEFEKDYDGLNGNNVDYFNPFLMIKK
jgi:hypothetical protein